jgi:hypothetical protein
VTDDQDPRAIRFPPVLGAEQAYDDDWGTLILLHIPKTAGSNLRHILTQQFGATNVYSPEPRTAPSESPYWRWLEAAEPFPGQGEAGWDPNEHVFRALGGLSEDQRWWLRAIMGHMWFGVHEVLARPASYLTVLRDPVERVLSLYYHRRDQDGLRMSLEDYVNSGRDFELDNGQTRYLCGRLADKDVRFTECTSEMLSSAQRHLREWFPSVGIAERFDETILLMARTFGWNVPFYEVHNVNRRRPRGREVLSRIRAQIAQRNRFDAELYTFAQRLFEEQLAALDPPLDRRTVRGFRRTNLLRRNPTLRAVYPVARPVLRAVRSAGRRTRRLVAGTAMDANQAQPAAKIATAMSLETRRIVESLEFVRSKIAPLPLDVRADVPRRVNLLVSEMGPAYFFGGRIAELNLALRLIEEGIRVRVVAVDPGPLPTEGQFDRFEGLRGFTDRVEIISAAGRSLPVDVSSEDGFVATNWWTAHISAAACRKLGRQRFLYLVQEYDFLAVPRGPYAALADQAYTFAHFALFSTEFLQSFFRHRGLGVYREGGDAGDRNSEAFRNAITPVGEVSAEDLARRSTRRLLMYARPETHGERNLFEIGMLGLSRAFRRGVFDGDWEFFGIGKQGDPMTLRWGGIRMRLLPRTTQDEYAELLRTCALGLALQYSPHPGLVSLEMASAGMPVVTNHFETKTEDTLRAISPNIIPVPPTVEGVASGLEEAAKIVGDYPRRTEGARVDWPTTWQEALTPEVMAPVVDFLRKG